MDIISYQKASKAKKAIQTLDDRLGEGVQSTYATVEARITELEKRPPAEILNGRVSTLASKTAINMNKHNLRVSSITNHMKYEMKELVFDDLKDTTGLDISQSSGYVLDSISHVIKIADGATEAIVVTAAEVTDITFLTVSIAGSVNEVHISRNGIDWAIMPLDVMQNISELASTGIIQIKFILRNGQQLEAYSYSWI